MNETQKKVIVCKALEKSRLFDMDKIELFYNKNGMMIIKDFTFKAFYNGIAILKCIDYYKKVVLIDVLKPNYLIHETMILSFEGLQ